MKYCFSIAAAIVLLAGCGAGGNVASLPAGVTARPRHPLAHSWMHVSPRGTTGTLWATDIVYASVDAIAYPSGTLIGQVSGFEFPYGDCSDKKGNVYVADFDAGRGYEIQAGTTNVINSWSTGGETIGCSVSDGGDVAFTDFDPGGVVVFAGGGPTGHTYAGPAYDWPAGYDAHGNLFVVCNYKSPCSSPQLAELRAGSSSWTLLNFSGALFSGAVQNTDKYLGIGGANTSSNGAIELVRVSGSDATVVKTITLHGGGCGSDAPVGSAWASIDGKPDGVTMKPVKDVGVVGNGCVPGPIGIYHAKSGQFIKSIGASIPLQYDEGVTFTKP